MAVTHLDEAGDPIYTYIENIFNSDYLQSKEKPARVPSLSINSSFVDDLFD